MDPAALGRRRLRIYKTRRHIMKIVRIGLDLAKTIFDGPRRGCSGQSGFEEDTAT